ncbi:hypothetical protein RP20_CCG027890 [Aedes albopictus]|nr:hypothetical protein RP20_CCG027890 [Aedes albopictus]
MVSAREEQERQAVEAIDDCFWNLWDGKHWEGPGGRRDRATPLFIAAQNGHNAVLKLLLAAGAQPDTPRNDGATPLWIASQMGHDHIVKMLLLHGAYVDAVRCDGATALFKAAHKGHSSVVHELLKYRPNLGLIPNGETALHAAALFGHLPIVKQLVAAGADVSLKNQEGMTPLQIARQQKYHSVYQYLKDREHYLRHQSAAVGGGGGKGMVTVVSGAGTTGGTSVVAIKS